MPADVYPREPRWLGEVAAKFVAIEASNEAQVYRKAIALWTFMSASPMCAAAVDLRPRGGQKLARH